MSNARLGSAIRPLTIRNTTRLGGDDGAGHLYGMLATQVEKASILVDAGCGRGAHLAGTVGAATVSAMRSRGGRVIGIDVDPLGAENPYLDEFHLLIDGPWPLESCCADVIFSDWVLEHVDDPADFFVECGRVLRSGGVLIARTLQRWSPAGIGARIVPNRFHPWLGARLQPGMNEDDIFPTRMRANTRHRLQQLCANAGLDAATSVCGGLGGYAAGRPRLAAILRGVEERLPPSMSHTLLLMARKVE